MMSRLLPIGCLLFAIGIFFGYIRPTWNGSIETSKAGIVSYTSALAKAKEYKEKEAELLTARNSIPPESLARLNAFLPDNIDNVQIILDLDALAARSGVKLSDFDLKNSTVAVAGEEETIDPGTGGLASPKPIDSADITLKVTGTYQSFRIFLTQIEQSLRMLDVVSVEIKDSKTGVYTYDLTIRIYSLR